MRKNLSNTELWQRLKPYQVTNPRVAFSFCDRLARENGWSEDFAKAVFEEYKKFCYLACISGSEVTPSDEVDQAWHLHLAYTRQYWDDFCPNILGRPLHHGPTSGGAGEARRYDSNYLKTLALYKKEFGIAPPCEIWPPRAIRFSNSADFRRVNLELFKIEPACPKPASTDLNTPSQPAYKGADA